MRPEDLVEWRTAVPFRPFRICLNSGRTYDIRHPEMLRVGRTTMHIYSFRVFQGNGEPKEPHEHMEMVGLLLIERIEPIEAPVPT
jgi:hypothetical protein